MTRPATAPHSPANYLAVRPDWLARRTEEVLEPDLPIVDAHHHPLGSACIDAFGVGRCMFESNFPVDKGSYSYGAGWNAFTRLTQGASHAEKTALFSATATSFYRLDGGS
jgi:L-fuconolactonase